MAGDVAGEVRRRNEQAAAGKVRDALEAALRDALWDLVSANGPEYLDVFLDRRCAPLASLRNPRPGEPPALTVARERDADAVEEALTRVVRAVRPAPPAS